MYSQRCASEFQNLNKEALKEIDTFSAKSINDHEILIPVAFHFHDVGSSDKRCLSELASALIERLNLDFNAANSEIQTKWPAQQTLHPTVKIGNSHFTFAIARYNHPEEIPRLIEGNKAITFNLEMKFIEEQFVDYLNVHIGQFPFYGLSPVGGTGKDNGIRISYNATMEGFDCIPDVVKPEYKMGRTITHEVGHYFGLNHLWGRSQYCGFDDQIEDTPRTDVAHVGCVNYDENCESLDLTVNFMDYVDDPCMYMFTRDQANYMRWHALNNLTNLISNATTTLQNEECAMLQNVQWRDEKGKVSILWDKKESHSYELAYLEDNKTDWVYEKLDSNFYEFKNHQYPSSFEYVVHNICEVDSVLIRSEPVIGNLILERPDSFYVYEWANVFPNPTTDLLKIEIDLDILPKENKKVHVLIWDTYGNKTLFETYRFDEGSSSTQITLNLSNLTSGQYFVRLHLTVDSKYFSIHKL